MPKKIFAAKIPQKEKEKKAIASGRFAVFGSLLKVGPAFVVLENAMDRKRDIPTHGYVKINDDRFYYCFYGVIADQAIYEKEK